MADEKIAPELQEKAISIMSGRCGELKVVIMV